MNAATQDFLDYYQNNQQKTFDPYLLQQWYLFNMNVIKSWSQFGHGSDDITIAVIDLDFDLTQEDYKNKIVSPKDFSIGKSWTIMETGETITIDTPFTIAYNRPHGTAVASIALAERNDVGIAGVAPNARFMPIRPDGFSDDSWIAAFEHAVHNGADVVCCAVEYTPNGNVLTAKMNEALDRLGDQAIFCFASGNSGKVTHEFANHPKVIGVGACDVYGALTTYSNTGSNINIVAPSAEKGMQVIAADFPGPAGNSPLDVDFNFGGTSAACPMVAGIVALMLSEQADLKVAAVKQILQETGVSIDAQHVKVDAYQAVKRVKALTFNLPITATFQALMAQEQLQYFEGHEFLIKGTAHSDPSHVGFGLNTDPPMDKWANMLPTARVLDEFRKRIEAPVFIKSAYRSPAYNAVLRGASPNSTHMSFQAIDFVVHNSMTPQEWADVLKTMREEGLFQGGIGVYDSFVHLDTRGENVDWDKRMVV